MFVQYSIHIERPIAEVNEALIAGPRKWFPRFEGPGQAEVGRQVAGFGFRTKVTIEVGEPRTTGDWTEVPVTWEATFIKRLFPIMTGTVALAAVDPHRTRLTVCGMYQPPLGRLGKHLDDALMHKVAEGTVKDLAESIADRLASTPDSVGGPV